MAAKYNQMKIDRDLRSSGLLVQNHAQAEPQVDQDFQTAFDYLNISVQPTIFLQPKH